ncbi:MAG: hypothetical protein K9M54_10755 [Kiritimatiellales bacterium]|nr:hypothetical protein [Kiritimatiellales bacterium]MCF7863274.1 hypothetical protein [Kiritimatiellales bacterium]
MKKILIKIWNIYCVVGAVWLTFSILSIGVFHRPNKKEVQGAVKEIIETEWNGISQVHAIIETEDGKGNVLAKLYKVGVESNDTVAVKISSGGSSRSYIHASVMN